MAGVLIISRDWQSRALLRAQLIEEGCDARAFTSAGEAAALLSRPAVARRLKVESRRSRFLPGLALADISLVSDRAEIDDLKSLVRNLPASIPLWIIASRSDADEGWIEMLGGPRLEKVLFRPIDAGKLIEEIKRRVQAIKS